MCCIKCEVHERGFPVVLLGNFLFVCGFFLTFQKIFFKKRKQLSHFQTHPLVFHIRTPPVNVLLLPIEFKNSLQGWDSSQTVTWGIYYPKLSNHSLYHALWSFKSHWEAQSSNWRHYKTCHQILLVLNIPGVLCIPSITQFYIDSCKSKYLKWICSWLLRLKEVHEKESSRCWNDTKLKLK